MSDPSLNRKQLFVDKDVQGVLLARVGVYWACCLITVTLLLLCWRILMGPSRELYVHLDYLWYHYRPILLAAFILLPILLADTLRLSNRFAGPMVRLRRGLTELADGRTDVAPVHFRSGDFWHEFASEFNRVVERVQQYPSPPGSDAASRATNQNAPISHDETDLPTLAAATKD
jgi:hypothetical protein